TRAHQSGGLAAASVGLARLGVLFLSLQLHRPARLLHSGGPHQGGIARGVSDRGAPIRRSDRPPGRGRLREGAAVAEETPRARLTETRPWLTSIRLLSGRSPSTSSAPWWRAAAAAPGQREAA